MKKILIVVDMQNDFITGSLGTNEAKAIVPKVLDKVHTFDGTVIFTADTHLPDYLSTQEGRNLPVMHCINGSYGWQLEADLQIFRNQAVAAAQAGIASADHGKLFTKRTFGCAELGEWLAHRYAVDHIEFVGLCTDICVISNVLLAKAYAPEAHIVVDASCCAGVTPESHRTALSAMKACQIDIINE